jgi:hypothetical protein
MQELGNSYPVTELLHLAGLTDAMPLSCSKKCVHSIAASAPISLPRELLVLDALGHHGVLAQSPLLVFLIVLEVALEPLDV